MDSEDDGFPKPGGEALEIGDDFDSEEEQDTEQAPPQPGKAGQKNPVFIDIFEYSSTWGQY